MSPPTKAAHKVSHTLTVTQRRMYASEKMVNFRWISKILATHSSYTLTAADLASVDLHIGLAEIGQFAEVAYGSIPTEFIFQNLTTLRNADFPLEGYNALQGSILVSSFGGAVAHLPVYVVYRPSTRQLVVAISGTSSFNHTIHDLRAMKHPHPSGRGTVHTGFWCLYQGIKASTLDAIRTGHREHDVGELVITGHSMGGALSYLLTLDLLIDGTVLSPGVALTIAVFGTPRSGNSDLVKFWREVTDAHRKKNGEASIREYSVKAYNDGVPALPPLKFGYRHFTPTPLYFVRGRLYHVPATESEYARFLVSPDSEDHERIPDHPRGGHNYYNGRDLEKFARRMGWLDKVMSKRDWEEQYRAHVAKHEGGHFRTKVL